ncbi:MAG TPA: M1 family peptidase, partial [Puia sp.]|nr:M1 family peptidase [Puia sp.]
FFTTNYIDLAVQKVDATNNGYTISIQNIGGFPIPFDIKINYEDGSSETIHKTPEIWSADQKQTSVNISTTKKIQSLKLDGGIFVDADESNNTWDSQ